ncbi:MAG TPA: presqualene diphosphate synthase HpnD, partial [Paraburkholderia sp.]|nr:presqualene diphosphate synthase HpnD [Paraburkholderia sp.]
MTQSGTISATATPPSTASSTGAGRASGSSFYTAMRILPPQQREAMFAIYGFCRQVDDIADSSAPREFRLEELAKWRHEIRALYSGQISGRTQPLMRPVRNYELAQADFQAIIDGMEMDASADIRAPSRFDLDLYCDRVASAVGRLSVRVFGMEAKSGRDLAHHLGRALQLTNILRDLDEDAEIGRLYLPREALEDAGLVTREPLVVLANPVLNQVCAELVTSAREHFNQA